ncbi:hypothetical protein D3C84_597550 [compost metagenome]
MFGVLRADVQFATQGLELGNRHFAFDRFDVEQSAFIGLTDEIGIRFACFGEGEVMQGGVQQGNSTSGDAT